VLARLLDGARIIGATDEDAWRVVEKTALDSMPAQRLAALRLLLGGAADTTAIAAALDLPTTTTRRTLEDLTAHHLVKRHSQGKGHADTWELTEWTRDRSRNLQQLYIDTEHGKREFSGTPVFGDHREQR
jgi:predicted ArsR family transcriptional regulator